MNEMTNVTQEVKTVNGKRQLIITVDLEPSKGTGLQLTSKGKSYQVATSNGFQKLDGEFKDLAFSMNLIMDKKAYEEQIARMGTAPSQAAVDASTHNELLVMREMFAQQQQQMAQMMQAMQSMMQLQTK